ncbi:uncharacterized protein T551_00491 [Pneumocystis jirovecii RU7]|uniref:Chromatin modification-related protein EAF7 n=1 Tax=Pneumocystis jirovecii (strain RU7) TaxID=1408657 RepID=A0A0W4ZVK3_PNEJ7|nr:uncharacterized protein T551_00491 [Pneumocystis jirovecii RU7]KTW32401.1 hypothetical protein T551_00491 [Pneumocystis jirovecii RU7]
MTNKHKEHEWTVDEEIALLRAVCKYRPIGIHKHFRIISIMQEMNSFMIKSADIWEKLKTLYNLELLDEISERFRNGKDNQRKEDLAQEPYFTEFLLPWEEYGEIMEEHRRASNSTSTSPPHLPHGVYEADRGAEEGSEIETLQTESPEPEATDDDFQFYTTKNLKKKYLALRIMRRMPKKTEKQVLTSEKNHSSNASSNTRTSRSEKITQNTTSNTRRSNRNKR